MLEGNNLLHNWIFISHMSAGGMGKRRLTDGEGGQPRTSSTESDSAGPGSVC